LAKKEAIGEETHAGEARTLWVNGLDALERINPASPAWPYSCEDSILTCEPNIDPSDGVSHPRAGP